MKVRDWIALRRGTALNNAMRYWQVLYEMSLEQARAIWQRAGADPYSPDLKAAHRSLVKKNHPDYGGDTETMALINAAYDVLKNPQAANSSGGYSQRGRQRNPWHSPGENERRDREQEDSDAPWAWAGYSGGMRNSSRIYREDYTDVNYIKKRMWELSGKSKEQWTIWGFDGHFLRGVTTVFGSDKIFAHMAEAMITWQTKGGNSYPCRAVLVEPHEPYRSKQYMNDEGEQEHSIYVIWADGVFYDKKPIPMTYETFNRNPGNDRSFNRRLERLLDELQENQGRQHDQPSMGMPGGSERESQTFETGDYVIHPKMGIGRVINPQIRKGIARVHFGDALGTRNVKVSSLQRSSRQRAT